MEEEMNFTIEEVVDVADGLVEVRARLEDGRLACITLPKGEAFGYEDAVGAYIAEHLPADDAPEV